MRNDDNAPSLAESLRAKAVERFCQRPEFETESVANPTTEDARRTIYELRVHQIELQMQNEELSNTQAQLELAKSRYFDLYDMAPMGYCTLTEGGTILETNLTLSDILGETRGRLLHVPFFRFVLGHDQDIYFLHRQQLSQTRRPQSCELRLVRKDGSVFYARLDSSLPFGPDGIPTCRMMVADVSERRRMSDEKRSLETRMGQFQKLESLGVLVAGVAHNMNNVLGSIMGAATLRESLAEDPADVEAFRVIGSACTRGRDVVRSLLQFAQPTLEQQCPFEMHALISEVRFLLGNTTRNRIEIVEDFCPGELWALGEAGNMSGAVMNLCINAIDAMVEGGTLRLRTSSHASDFMEVSVQDTGEGMTPEVIARAFEPFFTTKPVGKGTGLGLSMTHGVITAHGGTISIQSRTETGTTVKFRLPRIAAPRRPAEPIAAPSRQSGLEVLIVDDDDEIRMVVARMLEAMGHTTMSVSNGEEAISELRTPHEFDLIILDQNMPGMDGIHTLAEIRLLHPNMPVLVASGQLDVQKWTCFMLPHVLVIPKPFGMKELQEKIVEFQFAAKSTL